MNRLEIGCLRKSAVRGCTVPITRNRIIIRCDKAITAKHLFCVDSNIFPKKLYVTYYNKEFHSQTT